VPNAKSAINDLMPKILHRKNWPTLALLAVLVLTVVQLRAQGRIWFCECGQVRFWTSEADGPHTSQHLTDPYSFSHVQHGLLLFLFVGWAFRRWKLPWQLWLVLTIEAGWELLENTALVIDRYRMTAALGYNGDSILNSMGDILSCGVGWFLARRLGWRGTWLLFLTIELTMLLTIRDCLLLNVLMLVYPLDVVKQWQLG